MTRIKKLTEEQRRIVKKAFADKENLTHEEYAVMSKVANDFDLEHDLELKEASRRVLEKMKALKW